MASNWVRATTENGEGVRLFPDGTWEAENDEGREKDEQDFRKARWGMSQEEVIALEGETAERSEEILGYSGTVLGYPCLTIFHFGAGQLADGMYIFQQNHSQPGSFITDYESIQAMVDKKYGSGTHSGPLWQDRLYADDPSEWGMAVSMGHLMYFSEWTTPSTKIVLSLTGDNFETHLSLRYESISLAPLQKALAEKKALDDL